MALRIHEAQVELRTIISLISCLAKPVCGFHVILQDAQALDVQVPEVDLGDDIPLIGCLAEPAGGFGVILGNAVTLGVLKSQVQLCTAGPALASSGVSG